MMRPYDSIQYNTRYNWEYKNPILPANCIGVVSDSSGLAKIGDGTRRWLTLPYIGANTLASKEIDTTIIPYDGDIIWYDESNNWWTYRAIGATDSQTNWESNTATFDKYTLLIETDDITGLPTGRFKIADGATAFPTLPWYGADFDTTLWSAGESIEFNGTYFEPVTYLKPTELQSATTPTGLFHRDDGNWATMDTFTGLETVEADQGVFSTVYVGGFPTEATTVTLTSDGTDLFSDGNKVWTQYNDGTGSGLDADTLDGHHSTAFATGPVSAVEGNLVAFGASPNILTDSGSSVSDFATAGDIENLISEDDALAYSIAFGG